jgi:sensor domain CHASE-containing protein
MKLSVKFLLILAGVIILVTIVCLSWLNHRDFENAMIAQAQQQLAIIAKSEAQGLKHYLGDVQQELEILSTNDALDRIISGKYSSGQSDEGLYAPLRDSYKDINDTASAIYVLNSEGVVAYVIPFNQAVIGQDFSGFADLRRGLSERRPFISDVSWQALGEQGLTIVQPVFKNSKFVGLLRAVVLNERLNGLLGHIEQKGQGYAFMVNSSSTILSFPDASLIGKNIPSLSTKKLSAPGRCEFSRAVRGMAAGQEGAAVLDNFSSGAASVFERVILAYAPISIGNDLWSIAVVKSYNTISDPIHKNAAENLILAAFVLLVFSFLSAAFYRAQNKKAKLEIQQAALNIINKELHLELDERKKLERMLKN